MSHASIAFAWMLQDSIASAQQLQTIIASICNCGPLVVTARGSLKVKNQITLKSKFHGFFRIMMLFQDNFTKGVFCENKTLKIVFFSYSTFSFFIYSIQTSLHPKIIFGRVLNITMIWFQQITHAVLLNIYFSYSKGVQSRVIKLSNWVRKPLNGVKPGAACNAILYYAKFFP